MIIDADGHDIVRIVSDAGGDRAGVQAEAPDEADGRRSGSVTIHDRNLEQVTLDVGNQQSIVTPRFDVNFIGDEFAIVGMDHANRAAAISDLEPIRGKAARPRSDSSPGSQRWNRHWPSAKTGSPSMYVATSSKCFKSRTTMKSAGSPIFSVPTGNP